MNLSDQILEHFNAISVWKQGDQRDPHKPLLILFALGRWQGGLADVTSLKAEPALTDLLQRFGPRRKSDHPEQPFWRLQNDGVVDSPVAIALALEDGRQHSPNRGAAFAGAVEVAAGVGTVGGGVQSGAIEEVGPGRARVVTGGRNDQAVEDTPLPLRNDAQLHMSESTPKETPRSLRPC